MYQIKKQVKVSEKIYKEVEKVAAKIDLPITQFVSMMVIETALYEGISFERNKKNKKNSKKRDNSNGEEDVIKFHRFELYIDEAYVKRLEGICESVNNNTAQANISGTYKYNFSNLVEDCMVYQLEHKLSNISLHHSKEFSQILRVLNNKKKLADDLDKEGDIEKYYYKEETIAEAKEKSKMLEIYINKRAKDWGLHENTVKTYFLATAINDFMERNKAEIAQYIAPDDFSDYM